MLLAATPVDAGAARRPRAGGRARLAARRRRRRRARRARRARRRPRRRRPRARARATPAASSLLALPGAGLGPADLDELAPLAFEEHAARHRPAARPRAARSRPRARRAGRAARADRRRATRCASPRRSRGSAAAPRTRASVEEHEDAVLALLEPDGARRRARTRTPTRRGASPAGSSSASTAWASGAATTPTSPTSRAASPATTARSPRTVGEALLRRRAARREAVGRPAPRVPQPAPGGRDPPPDRRRRGCRRACGCRQRDSDAPSWTSTSTQSRPRSTTKLVTRSTTLAEAGHRAPDAPRPPRRRTAGALLRWGPTPAGRLHRRGRALPRRRRRSSTSSGTLTFREVHERTNALAHALAGRRDRRRATASAIMCRNHRGFIDAVVACSKLGANALFLNTAFSGPAADRRRQAREAEGARSTTRSSPSCSTTPARRRKRYVAWHEPDDGKPDDPRLEDLIDGGDTVRRRAAGRARARRSILTSGTTGTPKGASRSQPRVARPGRGAAVDDPAARRARRR